MKNIKTDAQRPWSRFLARMIDYLIFSLIVVTFFGLLVSPSFILWILCILGMFLLEGFLLSFWGFTPGKWLFKIKVRRNTGNLVTLKEGVHRAWLVFLRGAWLGIPVLSLVGYLVAYIHLSDEGNTSWDEDLKMTISKGRNY